MTFKIYLLTLLCIFLHESKVGCSIRSEPNVECVLSNQDFQKYKWHCNPECQLATTSNDLPYPMTGQLDGNTIWYFFFGEPEGQTNQAMYKNFSGQGYDFNDVYFYCEYYNGVDPSHESEMYVMPVHEDYINFLPSSQNFSWSSIFTKLDDHFIQDYSLEVGTFSTQGNDIVLLRQLIISWGAPTTEKYLVDYCKIQEEMSTTETAISSTRFTDSSSTTDSESSTVTESLNTTTVEPDSTIDESSDTTIESTTIDTFSTTTESLETTTTEDSFNGINCLNDLDSFEQFWGSHPKMTAWNDSSHFPDLPTMDSTSGRVWCMKGENNPGYIFHNLTVWSETVGLDVNSINELTIHIEHYFHVPGSYLSFFPTMSQLRDGQKRTFLTPSPKGVWSKDIININLVDAKA